MIVIWRCRIIHLNIIAKLHAVTQEKVGNIDLCFYSCRSFLRILTQMIKIIFDSYTGPCLSPIKYGKPIFKFYKDEKLQSVQSYIEKLSLINSKFVGFI